MSYDNKWRIQKPVINLIMKWLRGGAAPKGVRVDADNKIILKCDALRFIPHRGRVEALMGGEVVSVIETGPQNHYLDTLTVSAKFEVDFTLT